MIVKFEMTAADVEAGGICAKTCPVAIVVQRQLQPKYDVTVSAREIVLSTTADWMRSHHQLLGGDWEQHVIKTPPNVAQFIKTYDNRTQVQPPLAPITFELDIPEKYLALAGVAGAEAT